MSLSEKQTARIKFLLSDEWVADSHAQSLGNFLSVLAEVESPEELHQFAANFNWDTSIWELSQIVEHPQCDAGTALMIYFLGQPGFFYDLHSRGKPLIGEQPARFEFLKRLENKYLMKQFAAGGIKFDPTNWNGKDLLNRRGESFLPQELKQPTDGEEIKILNFQ